MQLVRYRYMFAPFIDITDVEATVTLALLATESLHGEACVRLETGYVFDAEHRTCEIDAASEVGRDFNQLFLGFMTREFGAGAFEVKPVGAVAATAA